VLINNVQYQIILITSQSKYNASASSSQLSAFSLNDDSLLSPVTSTGRPIVCCPEQKCEVAAVDVERC
jgi:hypothetical protein